MKIVILIITLALYLIPAASRGDSESPAYDSHTLQLSIPSVDSSTQPGAFQDAVFEYLPNGFWRLAEYIDGITIKFIDSVELIKTSTFPVQVFLKISGKFTNGCLAFGRVGHRLANNTFDVFIYYDNAVFGSPGTICSTNVTSFTKVIPLPVYDLNPGTYTYKVNTAFGGTFTLQSKNGF